MHNLYNNLIIIELSVLFTIGAGAFMLRLPKRDIYSSYRAALRLYGGIVTLWAVCLSMLAIMKWFDVDPLLSRTSIISVSYIIIRLFAAALCHLLGIKPPSRMGTIAARWMVINVILIAFAINFDYRWARIAIHTMNILAAVDAVAFGIHFHKIYRSRIEDLESYYSEDMDSYLKWMHKETQCFVVWLLVGYFTYPAGRQTITLHSIMGFLILLRLVVCFRGYLVDLHRIKQAMKSEGKESNVVLYPSKGGEGVLDNITVIQRVGRLVIKQMNESRVESAVADGDSHISRLEPRIKEWIESRGFLKPMINIESLALEFGTNRAYLSSYINKQYGVNFRNWVAGLRVEYSKQLLVDHQHLSIAQIAEMICYTQSSYSTIFKKHYGVSVSQWRAAALNR